MTKVFDLGSRIVGRAQQHFSVFRCSCGNMFELRNDVGSNWDTCCSKTNGKSFPYKDRSVTMKELVSELPEFDKYVFEKLIIFIGGCMWHDAIRSMVDFYDDNGYLSGKQLDYIEVIYNDYVKDKDETK